MNCLIRGCRGQAPILMLVVVTIVLVTTSLFAFASFSERSGQDKFSKDISEMVTGVTTSYNFIFDSAKNIAFGTINARALNIKEEFLKKSAFEEARLSSEQKSLYGNFFSKVREGEFDFSRVDEFSSIARLKIEGLFVLAEEGNNFVRRDFDLCILFNLEDGRHMKEISASDLYFEYCGNK